MSADETLKKYLDHLQKYHPAYGGGLSIHLPMALTALYRLGAQETRLREYFNSASRHWVEALPANETLSFQSAQERLGTGKLYSEYRDYFKRILSEGTPETVLKDWLPILAPGIAAHAFHSMIRLAYAIDIRHLDDIASSLAYWADMYQSLGEGNRAEPEKDIVGFLVRLRDISEFNTALLPEGSIHIRMREVAKRMSFEKVLWALKVETDTVATLADLAARWYFLTGDFTALHGVTSCHALSVLLPFTDNPEKLIQYYWQAFCAAYLTAPTAAIYRGAMEEGIFEGLRSWEELRSEAIHKEDEHDIKMIYSCWVEQGRYKSPIYQKLASDRLGLTVGAWTKDIGGWNP